MVLKGPKWSTIWQKQEQLKMHDFQSYFPKCAFNITRTFNMRAVQVIKGPLSSVHGKKKCAAGHVDQLLRKAAGPLQKLLVHALD